MSATFFSVGAASRTETVRTNAGFVLIMSRATAARPGSAGPGI
jgi:hypothetical protein